MDHWTHPRMFNKLHPQLDEPLTVQQLLGSRMKKCDPSIRYLKARTYPFRSFCVTFLYEMQRCLFIVNKCFLIQIIVHTFSACKFNFFLGCLYIGVFSPSKGHIYAIMICESKPVGDCKEFVDFSL